MKHDNLKERTKNIALRIIRLVEALPKSKTADVIGRQLLRSVQIIELLAGLSLRLTLFTKRALWRKRLTSLSFGWSLL